MARLHLIIGPVGAGKSNFGRQLSGELGAVRLTLDEWMAVLFGDDERPAEGRIQWYMERTARCVEQIWSLSVRLLEIGVPVVLEIGLIQRGARHDFYGRVDAERLDHIVYVVDAERDERRDRVLKRNREKGDTFSMEVPLDFFELASDLWEPPNDEECSERDVRFLSG
jgi:predicted kinase